ncbi:hypothetical protein KJ910_03575 [Patescibacteria group bacterium]|nr:hypothetical protein [Patescibacteria group bacterium]MBU1907154.1 hypothetical protein [Patescibacteria group bacterium]
MHKPYYPHRRRRRSLGGMKPSEVRKFTIESLTKLLEDPDISDEERAKIEHLIEHARNYRFRYAFRRRCA